MRQRRVTALTAPLSAAHSQQMCAVLAVDLQRDWRNEGACVTIPCLAASAGKSLLEVGSNLTIGIGEVAGGCVTVIRGDDQAPTSGEGTVNFASPTAYNGNFKIKTTQDGKPEQLDMAQTGRWLSNDCGAIKPAPAGR